MHAHETRNVWRGKLAFERNGRIIADKTLHVAMWHSFYVRSRILCDYMWARVAESGCGEEQQIVAQKVAFPPAISNVNYSHVANYFKMKFHFAQIYHNGWLWLEGVWEVSEWVSLFVATIIWYLCTWELQVSPMTNFFRTHAQHLHHERFGCSNYPDEFIWIFNELCVYVIAAALPTLECLSS